MAPLPVQDRGPGRKKVFTEYLMTGEKMFQIVKQKDKEASMKEAKTQKKEACIKNALAKFRQEERKAKSKLPPKKIKSNPKL